MGIYDDLRLDERDKIKKTNFMQKLFKRDSQISNEDLEFLEEYGSYSKDIKEEQEKLAIDILDSKKQSEEISLKIEEKDEILEKLAENSEGNISFKVVGLVFLLMFFVFALFVPKIYIRNNIYFTSRNIIQLQAQLDSLNEENRYIKKQLEDIKFRNLTHELDF